MRAAEASAPAKAAEEAVRMLGIHQAGEDPLGVFLEVGGQGDLVVRLHAGVLTEGFLEGAQRANHEEATARQAHYPPRYHRRRP